ncbi:DUF4272 domain-containing protein [Planosporangium flavigriseum]|uniref:DUF4272 domain-containing protein n=1 Tax=Planosporangium flavigriseum TaxID=373681 RepID=A0A8J3LKG5_9ACTN|nr:DUF4272 domain-containing protein [Planosporangium flavigriseum]NJC63503.1 DUF4272 domain-containing protein [Planosporangium flavigriseum]GIG72200.1 hypothetical protein Pfl04_06040 [Planosporangium flavigriseum]
MAVPAPDPHDVRKASLAELRRFGLPLPPPNFPLVWDPGDTVDLRPLPEIEARVAVLNVLLGRCFGMPPTLALGWLLDAHLDDRLTGPERRFVTTGEGDPAIFVLHLEAVFALAWVLGIALDLDPLRPSPDGLVERLPDLPRGESYADWLSRTLTAPRDARQAAALLDLYYCLDWAHLEAERRRAGLPGPLDSNGIGQRRWALEWAVVFTGPHHDPPPAWDEIDLS